MHVREYSLAAVLWPKRKKLVGDLQALRDVRRVRWKSLFQPSEKVETFSERLQSERPDVHSSSLGNFVSYGWRVAREMQSIPTKLWPNFV